MLIKKVRHRYLVSNNHGERKVSTDGGPPFRLGDGFHREIMTAGLTAVAGKRM
jgi:hypothetical protein